MTMIRAVWMALPFSFLLLGCGGAPPPTTPPDPGAAPAVPSTPLSPAPLPQPGAWHGPGRPTWSGQGDWQPSPLEIQLAESFGRALAPSAALDCLGREYAARFAADGHDPDPATVAALGRHCGAWARPARVIALTGRDQAAVEAGLARVGAARLAGAVGLGAVTHPEGAISVALVFPANQIHLDPVPRASQTARLTGRALGVDGSLSLWRRGADGIRSVPLEAAPTGSFAAELTRDPAETVTYELAAERGRFRQTLAMVILEDRPPGAYPASPRRPRPTLESVRREALAHVNGRRAGAGLPPLGPAPRLSPALDEWLDRLAGGDGGDAPDGVLDPSGRPYARLAFALGEGADGAQAAQLILATPTGEASLLDRDLSQLAVGARPFSHGEGVDVVLAALQTFDAPSPAVARIAIQAAFDRARSAARLPAHRADAALDAVAQAVAEEAMAGALPWAGVSDAVASRLAALEAVQGGFAVGGLSLVSLEGPDLGAEPPALEPQARRLGIGVASGALPGGAPRHLVIYITADLPAGR